MLLDVIEQRHICISLRIFDPEDLATGWEVKAIIEIQTFSKTSSQNIHYNKLNVLMIITFISYL